MEKVIEIEKMPSAEVQQVQDDLGLKNPQLATMLGISIRTIVLWRRTGASVLGTLALRYLHLKSKQEQAIK